MNGNGGGAFLRQAALLTGICVGIVTVVLTVFVPLYSRSSPIDSQVQSNAQAANQHDDRDALALDSLFRQQQRTLALLREALISSCQRGNTIRRNQMKVLARLDLDGESIKIVDCEAVVP